MVGNNSLESSKKDLEALITKNELKPKKYDYFVIEIKGKFTGVVGLSEIEKGNKARVGYWVSREFRQKGIANQAITLISNYSQKEYNLKSIYAKVAEFNKISVKSLEKSNFKLIKTIKNNRKVGETYCDDLIFSKNFLISTT